MITFDDIWLTFLNNYKVEDIDLPHPERIPEIIQDALMRFNNRMRTKAKCDFSNECVVGLTSEDDLLLLAHYIKLIQLINSRVHYESLYNPFAADVGVRNFKTQLDSLNGSIKDQEKLIDEIIFNAMEDFL